MLERPQVRVYVCYHACIEVVRCYVAWAMRRPEFADARGAAARLAPRRLTVKLPEHLLAVVQQTRRLVAAVGKKVFDDVYRYCVQYHRRLAVVIPRYAWDLVHGASAWLTLPGVFSSLSRHVMRRPQRSKLKRELRRLLADRASPPDAGSNEPLPPMPGPGLAVQSGAQPDATGQPRDGAQPTEPTLPLRGRGAVEDHDASFLIGQYLHRRDPDRTRGTRDPWFRQLVKALGRKAGDLDDRQAASTQVSRVLRRRPFVPVPPCLRGTRLLDIILSLDVYG